MLIVLFLLPDMRVYAQGMVQLPIPGARLELSPVFAPPLLKGIKAYRNDPFRFDFILDKGDAQAADEEVKTDSTRLIKYFLASLTVPEKDLWVNLSPYEKDRIVPEAFGWTEMGRDLLAQDYILKQITASIIYPDEKAGKEFWKKIYAEVFKRYGTTDISVDTFNKVWIIPEKATVYENKDAAFVVESKLKVMLEKDYIATIQADIKLKSDLVRQGANAVDVGDGFAKSSKAMSSRDEVVCDILREVVIPILEKEVNEGKNFAPLRQVYNSLILATWYKRKVKASVMGQAYVDKRKTGGIDIADKNEKEKIWAQYVEAFKKGAFNFIKEEQDEAAQQMIPRRYFSGGTDLSMEVFKVVDSGELPGIENIVDIRVDMAMESVLSDGTNFSEEQADQVVEYLMSSDEHDIDELGLFGKKMGFSKDIFFELIRFLSSQKRFRPNPGKEPKKWTSFLETYSIDGKPKNRVKSYWAVKRDMAEWTKTIYLFVFSASGNVLLQVRNDGSLEASVAGNVDIGLNSQAASIIEANEEMSLLLKASQLQKVAGPQMYEFDDKNPHEYIDTYGVFHSGVSQNQGLEIYDTFKVALGLEAEQDWRERVKRVFVSWEGFLEGERSSLNDEVSGIVEVHPQTLVQFYLSCSEEIRRKLFSQGLNGQLARVDIRNMLLSQNSFDDNSQGNDEILMYLKKTDLLKSYVEHEECYKQIKNAVNGGYIPKGLPFILFDQHSDDIPINYYARQIEPNSANFISYLLDEGWIKNAFWVHPEDRKAIMNDESSFVDTNASLSKILEENLNVFRRGVILSFDLDYFASTYPSYNPRFCKKFYEE